MAIREASLDDAEACAAIYAPYVHDTVTTFDLEAPTTEDMAVRIAASRESHAWFVLQDRGKVTGYAYGAPMRERAAYRWACEVSVYLEVGLRRTGAGRALYEALFSRLVERGYLVAVAGMTLPNPASEGLHQAMGFETVGIYPKIGWKHGAWHDVAWVRKQLAPQDATQPAEPH